MSSKSFVVVGLAVLFATAMVAAQTSGAQAAGAAANQTSVSAGRSGAQVDSQTSAQASGSVSHDGKKSGKAEASGSNSSRAAAGKGSARLASGNTINAVLSKPVDVKKNKPGDEVTAKVQQDVKSSASGSSQVVIPKGSRLVGHVTEAKRRDKEHAAKKKGEASANGGGQADSALGIVFDKAILKNGQEVPLQAVIQAVGAAQQNAAASAMPSDLTASGSTMDMGSASASGGRSGGGGLLGGVGSTVGATTGAAGNTTAEVGRTVGGAVETTANTAGSVTSGVNGATTATGQLTSSAGGVVGLQGLNLNSAASGSTQGSLITSSTRDVRLDSGTQMVLRVVGSAQ